LLYSFSRVINYSKWFCK